MIETILIANRGEIALRVMRTCRRVGIRTVAVYSDADRDSPHVRAADEAVHIGAAPASDSYLDGAAILAACRRSRARAVHPGYGFLSENADFAQAVTDAGLIWIGPSATAMRALGDKSRARAVAETCGVPLLAGYHGQDQSTERLLAEAERIGWPVLVKASAGGGGRGMRVAHSGAEFADALEAAQREAQASFGTSRVLLEKYVRAPRHVEVQIIGDLHGGLLSLGERDCSVQRRHQKLLEESPAPGLDDGVRRALADAALTLARASGYTNAGTVEFLVDAEHNIAFLEVNARLQVEHPVTELVTGLDLVELQIRVADGERLPITQSDVSIGGHAIEARVVAEDASAGFLPSSGRIVHLDGPPADVRFDSWVESGTTVSPYYDSLLGKIIAHGATRCAARAALARALRETWIDGIATNIDLLLAVIEDPAFASGDLRTDFLEEHAIVPALGEIPPTVLAAVAARDVLAIDPVADPWRARSGWRLGRVDQPTSWHRATRAYLAAVSSKPGGDGVTVRVGDACLSVSVRAFGPPAPADGVLVLDVRDPAVPTEPAVRVRVWDDGPRRLAELNGRTFRLEPRRALEVADAAHTAGGRAGAETSGTVTAPMPGRIVRLEVTPGQTVAAHQRLLVLEAMKMEHVLEAPHDATVETVAIEVGQQVRAGAVLVVLGPAVE